MPGGPTQPDLSAVLAAIRDGATLAEGHLRLSRGLDDASRDRWLAVIDTPAGPAWALSRTLGVTLDPDVFADLQPSRCRMMPDGRSVVIDGLLFALVAPSPLADAQIAILATAAT